MRAKFDVRMATNTRPILKLSKPRVAPDRPAEFIKGAKTTAHAPRGEAIGTLPLTATPPDLPLWWRCVENCRRISELPLLGLPTTPRDQPRPLVQGATQALVDAMTAAGKTRSATDKARTALRRYRLSRAYSRACVAQADALDLLTGATTAPVSDRQKADAAARLAEIK